MARVLALGGERIETEMRGSCDQGGRCRRGERQHLQALSEDFLWDEKDGERLEISEIWLTGRKGVDGGGGGETNPAHAKLRAK